MKKHFYLVLFVTALFTSSCFIADDILLEKKAPKLNLKQKTQAAITKYIKANNGNDSYYKYGYSDLEIHKPKELIELDELKAVYKKNNSTKTLDKIKQLEQKIKVNKIRYTIEMDHIFSITNKLTLKINLFETKFILSDSLTVTDVKPLIITELNDETEDIFADYFFEHPIFIKGEYYQNKSLSNNFYKFLKSHQQNLSLIKEKSEFLDHSLWLCNQIKKNGEFNQTLVLKKLVNKTMRENLEIELYGELQFSDLFEIKEDENLKGYYFFHKFSHLKDRLESNSVVYVGFSPFYEISEILEVPKPYKQYFDE